MINSTNPTSIVTFSERRLDPVFGNEIIKEGQKEGLSNSKNLNENLNASEYIPVLKAIWSERNKNRRLEWLHSHAFEMHAPLMYEQSIAEFVISPTVETVNQISIPLIQAASFRVIQDSKCSTDPSVFNGDAALRMKMTYQKVLNNQTEKHLFKKLEAIISENKNVIISAVKTKVLEIAQSSISQELPSPNWIGSHGLNVFITGKIEMYPITDFKKIRDKIANETISLLKTENNK